MGSKSSPPKADADLLQWSANLNTVIGENASAFGVSVPQAIELGSRLGDFQAAERAYREAVAAAEAARAAKESAKQDLLVIDREIIHRVLGNAAVTDAMRQRAGIAIRRSVPPPIARADTTVAAVQDLTHTLRIVNSVTSEPAKPEGVRGVEVWMKVVDPGAPAPADPNDLDFAGFCSTGTFVREFGGDQAGKTVYYRSRYLTTTGGRGPWGSQVSATVAA